MIVLQRRHHLADLVDQRNRSTPLTNPLQTHLSIPTTPPPPMKILTKMVDVEGVGARVKAGLVSMRFHEDNETAKFGLARERRRD
jgi:hypothetical protein